MELGLSLLSLLSSGSQFLLTPLVTSVLGPDDGSPGCNDGSDACTAGRNESAVTICH